MKMHRVPALVLVVGFVAAARAFAGDGPTQNAAHTSFDPREHGFAFTNYFEGDVLVDVPLVGQVDLGDSTYGLCGGMTHAALDTFSSGGTAPPGDEPPESGTQLRSYLYGRQLNTFEAHDAFLVVRLVAWSWRPIESNWLWTGLHELSKDQFFDVIAPALETGRPVTLCVIRSDIHDYLPNEALSADGFLENHQVLAIGFRRCAETSGAKAHWGIDVYDPNHPGRVCTLHLLADGGVLTEKTKSDGSSYHDIDDPTEHVVGDFRGLFATPYTAKVPFWVDESPSSSLLKSIAKMQLAPAVFELDDTPSGKRHAPGGSLAELLAQSSSRVQELRATIAALEAQIAARETGGKSSGTPSDPPAGKPAGKSAKGAGGKKRE